MQEWNDSYNSFNSNKGLMYKQWYDAILKGEFLPPIEASIDPVNDCNLDCFWCNNKVTKDRHVKMSDRHLLDLIDFMPIWGVKAICIAGGGEPTMHPALGEAFERSKLPIAIITNGLFRNEQQMKAIAQNARWIGVSVDAARRESYEAFKKSDVFDIVIKNMRDVREYGARELTFKFLIHPSNQHQIYDACRIAKNIAKAHRIHIRPISFMNYSAFNEQYDIESIEDQVLMARRDFEDENFKIFYITHKFNKDLHAKFPFSKCRATPIMPIFHANGDMSICIDRKNEEKMVFGRHDPIEEIEKAWGSDKHKHVIESVNLKECPKCTFNAYNEQIEKVIFDNRMDWEFT